MKIFHLIFFYLVTLSVALASPDGHVHSETGVRVETFTESFELVGHLQTDELSIFIDRYETNEPVLHGKLEVELNGLKAPAKFHADHGDYAVDDERVLKALAKPGKHPLIFTFTAGKDSDLLEGTLEVKDDHTHAPASLFLTWVIGVISSILAASLFVALVIRSRRRQP